MHLVNILTNFNVASFLIELGMLIIAIVSINIASRRALDKKFDAKADKDKVESIEADIKCMDTKKADLEYVRERDRAVHHRIDEEDKHKMGILNQMQSTQDAMQKDIKDILKLLINQKK